MALAGGAQGGHRHPVHRPDLGPDQAPDHHRGGHQGQPHHRRRRPDPVSCRRGQPVRLLLRRRQPAGTRDGLFHLGAARTHGQLRRPQGPEPDRGHRAGRRERQRRRGAVRRGLDQRPAQEPAAAERLHGAAMPLHRRPLRHRAGRGADHADRPAGGGGPRAVRHQQHPQPGGRGHQHRPRRRRAADHDEQARRGHRQQQRPGGGRAAARAGQDPGRDQGQRRHRTRWPPMCATCASRC